MLYSFAPCSRSDIPKIKSNIKVSSRAFGLSSNRIRSKRTLPCQQRSLTEHYPDEVNTDEEKPTHPPRMLLSPPCVFKLPISCRSFLESKQGEKKGRIRWQAVRSRVRKSINKKATNYSLFRLLSWSWYQNANLEPYIFYTIYAILST